MLRAIQKPETWLANNTHKESPRAFGRVKTTFLSDTVAISLAPPTAKADASARGLQGSSRPRHAPCSPYPSSLLGCSRKLLGSYPCSPTGDASPSDLRSPGALHYRRRRRSGRCYARGRRKFDLRRWWQHLATRAAVTRNCRPPSSVGSGLPWGVENRESPPPGPKLRGYRRRSGARFGPEEDPEYGRQEDQDCQSPHENLRADDFRAEAD